VTRLFRAAGQLGVPATYALYFGPVENRGLRCGPAHDVSCESCQRKTISLLPGLRAQFLADGTNWAARQAFEECVALEELADTTQNQVPAIHIGLDPLPAELQRWMTEQQVGARQVAKRIYQMVIRPNEVWESADVASRVL
jgi:hypothetical protein